MRGRDYCSWLSGASIPVDWADKVFGWGLGSWRRWWGRLGCEGLDWEVVETSNRPEARRPSMALFEL